MVSSNDWAPRNPETLPKCRCILLAPVFSDVAIATGRDMKKIRIGIVGAGRMGITHLAILKTDPRVEVTSIADSSGVALQVLAKYLRVGTFDDFNTLLKRDRPDALVVCTPPASHYEIVRAALGVGIPVFAEKPFTTRSGDARELADAFEKSGLVNQVGYVNRFNDVFIKVRELIAQGLIGEVIRYRTEMFSRTVIHPQESSSWRGVHATGGGATFEMASHAIDLVNFVVGKPDRVIGTAMDRVFSREVEDAVSATFVHANGKTGTLFVNWSDEAVRKPVNRLEFIGKKGKIQADQYSVRVYLRSSTGGTEFHEGWNTLFITDLFKAAPFYLRGCEYTRQLYHFVDRLCGGEPTGHCSFREAAETLEVIEGMFAEACGLQKK